MTEALRDLAQSSSSHWLTSAGAGARGNRPVEPPWTPLLHACRGKSLVKQHQLVNKILASDIATWHGLTLELKTPPS